MIRKTRNLAGWRIGKLLILEFVARRKCQAYWLCVCECGNEVVRRQDHLIRNMVSAEKANGCRICVSDTLRLKHGDAKAGKISRLFITWVNMRRRCSNPNVHNWTSYGGKGIRVCTEWESNYTAFKSWALSHGYTDELTIDRINPDGNYDPSNCRWITKSENSRRKGGSTCANS